MEDVVVRRHPTPNYSVAPESFARDIENVLSLPPQDIGPALMNSGAMNAGPPLPHSSHLKNKRTNLVLPWTAILAEQKDLMVPCDQYGNTDPAAWEKTVVEEEDDTNEQERLYWQARKSLAESSMQLTGSFYQDPRANSYPPSRLNVDAMSLDDYYRQRNGLPPAPASYDASSQKPQTRAAAMFQPQPESGAEAAPVAQPSPFGKAFTVNGVPKQEPQADFTAALGNLMNLLD